MSVPLKYKIPSRQFYNLDDEKRDVKDESNTSRLLII